jgi:hypothetical protein
MIKLRRLVVVALCLITLGWGWGVGPRVQAHGGVVIETGAVDHYEWLIQVYPYPAQPGVGVLTIFIFDNQAERPAMDFTGTLYLVAPGDPEPCCQPGIHRGPYELYTDPVVYPGDYTTYVPLDRTGEWQLHFRMQLPSAEYEMVAKLPVAEVAGVGPVDVAAIATQAALMSQVAAGMQQASMGQSPLATPMPGTTSPLTLALSSPLPAPGAPAAAAPLAVGAVTAPTATFVAPQRFSPWVWGGMAALMAAGAVIAIIRLRTEE